MKKKSAMKTAKRSKKPSKKPSKETKLLSEIKRLQQQNRALKLDKENIERQRKREKKELQQLNKELDKNREEKAKRLEKKRFKVQGEIIKKLEKAGIKEKGNKRDKKEREAIANRGVEKLINRFSRFLSLENMPQRLVNETPMEHMVRIVKTLAFLGYEADDAYRRVADFTGVSQREVYSEFKYVGVGDFEGAGGYSPAMTG